MTKDPTWVHCAACSHEWVCAYLPLPVDTVAKLCKQPCPMCGGKKVFIGQTIKATPEGDPIAWLGSGDTGTSSKTIWHVMMGRTNPDRWSNDVPYDPDDFGRCYRLLKIMPSWRDRLPEVAAKFPKWRKLVAQWDELTALYERDLPTGICRELYERMTQLLERKSA